MLAGLRQARGRPLVVGHRGAMSHAPENTFASFSLALQQGADLVELDVHLTADEVAVVIHDETLERTTDGRGAVSRLTLAELRQLDAGSWFGPAFAGERVPTLDEVLDWAAPRVPLAVELKGVPHPHPRLVEVVVGAIQHHAMLERVALIAFDHPALANARALEPRLQCGVLYACRPADPLALARAVGAEALLPHWSFVVADDVARAQAVGLAFQPWETSDPDVIAALLAAGVDGIASNSPAVARRVAERFAVS